MDRTTSEEFNAASILDRSALRTQFEQQQQKQQQQPPQQSDVTAAWVDAESCRKLLEGEPPFPLVDLPATRDDSIWTDIRSEYKLSLSELSSLKNRVGVGQHQPQQQQSDVTTAWVDAESEAVSGSAEYGGNNMLRLAEFLKTGPSTRAPVDQIRFNEWKNVVAERELLRYFRPVSEGDFCKALSNVLTMLLLHPLKNVGENEDGYHGRIDQCISEFLNLFAPEFKLRRNSSKDSSSYPLKRPDLSATIRNKGCFFRGEEKNLDSNEDPKEELYSKLQDTWPFPGLSFVLGYYSTGATVTFCAVSKKSAHPLHDLTLNLDKASARLRCWNTIRNVSRVIKFMASCSNSISPYDLQDLEKSHTLPTDWSRRISFSGGHVLKEIHLRDGQTQAKLDRFTAVLALLRNGTEGVQPIINFSLSSSVKNAAKRRRTPPCLYLLTAFGTPIPRVRSTAELRAIVEFLFSTVQRIHSLGITHRDIRLGNIVRNDGDGSYGLIDWDDSVVGLENLPNADVAHLVKETHAPEMFVENGTHDRTVDIWSIGYLVHSQMEYADTALVQLKERLMREQPHLRPSITEARQLLE